MVVWVLVMMSVLLLVLMLVSMVIILFSMAIIMIRTGSGSDSTLGTALIPYLDYLVISL